jgi:hypothetical protein
MLWLLVILSQWGRTTHSIGFAVLDALSGFDESDSESLCSYYEIAGQPLFHPLVGIQC